MMETFDQSYFEKLSDSLLKFRKPKEHLFIGLTGEHSQFVRFNASKVRQIGTVQDATMEITLVREAEPASAGEQAKLQKCVQSITLSGLSYDDQSRAADTLKNMRSEIEELPIDPFAQLPLQGEKSSSETRGRLLSEKEVAQEILRYSEKHDLAGIYAAGPIVRAMASSSGHNHWFLTENFSLDYSLYTQSQRAMKGTVAGSHWNSDELARQMKEADEKLEILERAPKTLSRGSYRCYLAPAAVFDLIQMMSWGCIGEASIRQGDSALRKMRSGEQRLSPLMNLFEDFSGGEVPRFNSEGELAPAKLALFSEGKLMNTLVSSRSAKEYSIPANQAESSETLRSASLAPGKLRETDILKTLDTGLYLSNLHYLNWSDQPGGRITGMTRYACFWVENGKIVAPIENMRFDDSIFSLFGSSLVDLTTQASYIPEVGSYYLRSIGGIRTPGILVSNMNFTL